MIKSTSSPHIVHIFFTDTPESSLAKALSLSHLSQTTDSRAHSRRSGLRKKKGSSDLMKNFPHATNTQQVYAGVLHRMRLRARCQYLCVSTAHQDSTCTHTRLTIREAAWRGVRQVDPPQKKNKNLERRHGTIMQHIMLCTVGTWHAHTFAVKARVCLPSKNSACRVQRHERREASLSSACRAMRVRTRLKNTRRPRTKLLSSSEF